VRVVGAPVESRAAAGRHAVDRQHAVTALQPGPLCRPAIEHRVDEEPAAERHQLAADGRQRLADQFGFEPPCVAAEYSARCDAGTSRSSACTTARSSSRLCAAAPPAGTARPAPAAARCGRRGRRTGRRALRGAIEQLATRHLCARRCGGDGEAGEQQHGGRRRIVGMVVARQAAPSLPRACGRRRRGRGATVTFPVGALPATLGGRTSTIGCTYGSCFLDAGGGRVGRGTLAAGTVPRVPGLAGGGGQLRQQAASWLQTAHWPALRCW